MQKAQGFGPELFYCFSHTYYHSPLTIHSFIRHVNYLSIFQLVGSAESFPPLPIGACGVASGLVGFYRLAFLLDNLHVGCAGILHNGEILAAEYLGHVHVHHHGHHQGHGEDHSYIEQVDYDAQRVIIVLLQQ